MIHVLRKYVLKENCVSHFFLPLKCLTFHISNLVLIFLTLNNHHKLEVTLNEPILSLYFE